MIMKKIFHTDQQIYDLFIQKANDKLKGKTITFIDEDELDTKAQSLFHQLVNEIENEIFIGYHLYDSGEEWYDKFYDDVMEHIYLKIVVQNLA